MDWPAQLCFLQLSWLRPTPESHLSLRLASATVARCLPAAPRATHFLHHTEGSENVASHSAALETPELAVMARVTPRTGVWNWGDRMERCCTAGRGEMNVTETTTMSTVVTQ